MLTTEQRFTIDARIAQLASFESADDIAKFFEACHIKGVSQDILLCPVATYLGHDLPVEASVNQWTYAVYEKDLYTRIIDGNWTNHAVYKFVTGFDNGDYPHLDLRYEAKRVWYAPWRRVWRMK